MSRKEERAQLKELLDSLPLFGLNTYEKGKIVTAMLDGGYRYNPIVVKEVADKMPMESLLGADGANRWVRGYSRELEDSL